MLIILNKSHVRDIVDSFFGINTSNSEVLVETNNDDMSSTRVKVIKYIDLSCHHSYHLQKHDTEREILYLSSLFFYNKDRTFNLNAHLLYEILLYKYRTLKLCILL